MSVVLDDDGEFFRILCTHHVQFLQEADMVVALDNGAIKHCGPPSDVLPLVTMDNEITNDAEAKEESDIKQVRIDYITSKLTVFI